MLKPIGGLAFVSAALILSACSNTPENGDSNDAITVRNGATQTPPGPAPAEVHGQEFVSAVLGGYDFAIASARTLSEKAQTPQTRQFAQKMAADFNASLDQLKAVAATGKLKLESAAGPTDQTDLAILSSAKGIPLEKAFVDQQLNRLSELVGLIRAYKNGGDNPELRAWAEKAQTVVNDRLLAVQTLKAELDEADEKPAA